MEIYGDVGHRPVPLDRFAAEWSLLWCAAGHFLSSIVSRADVSAITAAIVVSDGAGQAPQ